MTTTPHDQRALDGARQAALAALRAAGPARPWQGHTLLAIAAVAAMTLAGGLLVALGNAARNPALAGRLPALALLLFAQGVAVWSATAPGRFRLAPLAWLLVASGAVAVLAGRGAVAPDSSAGWVCSLSHLAFGLAPLAAITWALRDMAGNGRRALTAGLAVATAGLFWGEVACQRDAMHVLLHHFGAACVLVVACLLASRLIRRRVFAP